MTTVALQLALGLFAAAVHGATSPTVTVHHPQATIKGSTSNNVDTFDSIPFAQPPIGSLRLKPPLPISTPLGSIDGTQRALKCLQVSEPVGSSDMNENCLTLKIQRPSTTQQTSALPVVFWIYGGSFTSGSTSKFDGTAVIQRSVQLGGPIIYITANYRLGAFGWLPGQEVLDDGSANLGLLDQRLGLEWVADNIAQFGGDPLKVTIWGESAGSASVFNQMALYKGHYLYKGHPLFRGAIMNSGSIVPAEPVNGTKGQVIYNSIVNATGCSGANSTLDCLRTISNNTLLTASDALSQNQSYSSLAGGFKPRPDGVVLAKSPELLVNQSLYAKIPFIVGDVEDEGTSFARPLNNITNTTDVIDYFSIFWFPETSKSLITQLVDTYPDDPADGSPFRTGTMYNIYPEYKRMAAIMGDLAFTLTRRVFLYNANRVNPTIPSWSYLGSQNYGSSKGTSHASDVGPEYGNPENFFGRSAQTYYISFINALDPNALATGYEQWPRWSDNNTLLWFEKSNNSQLADDFRNDSYAILAAKTAQFRI